MPVKWYFQACESVVDARKLRNRLEKDDFYAHITTVGDSWGVKYRAKGVRKIYENLERNRKKRKRDND